MMKKIIKCKCSLTQMCKMIQIKLVQVALITMNKIKWLVHHLNPIIKQVQAIKFQSSNQPILQEIIHWTLSLVIFQEVCVQDQDWSSFDSEVIGLHWFSFLWLIGSFLDTAVQLSCSLSLHYHKLVIKLFSVASCQSLLVWSVWLFS